MWRWSELGWVGLEDGRIKKKENFSLINPILKSWNLKNPNYDNLWGLGIRKDIKWYEKGTRWWADI